MEIRSIGEKASAIQWTGDNEQEVRKFLKANPDVDYPEVEFVGGLARIPLRRGGLVVAGEGNYLLQGEESPLRSTSEDEIAARWAPEGRGDSPGLLTISGIADQNVGEVVSLLAHTQSRDLVDTIEALEEAGKGRKGVLEAAAARREELDEGGDEE